MRRLQSVAVLLRGLRLFCFLLLAMGVLALPASASVTTATINFGTNLGHLTYTVVFNTSRCFTATRTITYFYYEYYGFTYYSPSGSSVGIPGTTSAQSGGTSDPSCPVINGKGPNITYNGGGYTITIFPGFDLVNATIGVQGFVDPKYIVLGVTYAPPGPSSFVQYSENTLFSNTSGVSSSFTSAVSQSVKTTVSEIAAIVNGSVSTTYSTAFTQTNTNSSSTTVSKTSSYVVKVPGPLSPYVGVDHDFDVIWVWLNPVALFTLTSGSVQWNGYGYSTLDQPTMDIFGVYAGCLNGDMSCPDDAVPFARAWAAGESWASGQAPALNATDLANILAADPYGKCNASSLPGSTNCPSVSLTRYTLTSNEDVQYEQPGPGGQPFTVGPTYTYSDTSTEGQSASYTSSQAFGWEQTLSDTFGGMTFKIGFSETLTNTQTLTWTNQWNSQFTSGTTNTAQTSLTGPPCAVSGGVCSPAYPPTTPAYGEAVEFDIYQDNLFGTFLFVPVAY